MREESDEPSVSFTSHHRQEVWGAKCEVWAVLLVSLCVLLGMASLSAEELARLPRSAVICGALLKDVEP